jgi:Domain of unknown function (DUF4214)
VSQPQGTAFVASDNANHPPQLTSPGDQTIQAGQTLSLQLSAPDADLPKQTLTFSLLSGPAGLTLSPSGQLTWMTTTTTAAGTSPVSVQVSDGVDVASATFQVTVSAAAAPGSPGTPAGPAPQPSPGTPAPGSPGAPAGSPAPPTLQPSPGTPAGPPAALPVPNKDPNQLFVKRLYLDLLGRPADPSGLRFYVGLLDSGRATRLRVVQLVENRREFRTRQIKILDRTLLDRPARPRGLKRWLRFLQRGGTLEQVKAAILASPESFAHASGTIKGFVATVYHRLLHRAPDRRGARTWGRALARGMSRLKMVTAILNSPEGIAVRVAALSGVTLHLPADPVGFARLARALAKGQSDERALATLAASDEYFVRAQAGL